MLTIPLKSQKTENPVEQIAVNAATASKMLSISERTLWLLDQKRPDPAPRIGKRILYSVEALKAFVAGEEKKD